MATREVAKAGKQTKASASSASSPKKIGRPRAKHSSPDYMQMSIYIHKEVRSKVKMRLFESSGEFSGLVEGLLKEWLKSP